MSKRCLTRCLTPEKDLSSPSEVLGEQCVLCGALASEPKALTAAG
jgi:hypothetical protein